MAGRADFTGDAGQFSVSMVQETGNDETECAGIGPGAIPRGQQGGGKQAEQKAEEGKMIGCKKGVPQRIHGMIRKTRIPWFLIHPVILSLKLF